MKMMTLTELQERVRTNTLDCRSMDYFVKSYKFTKTWATANEDEKKHIIVLVLKNDIILLKCVINRIICKDIGEKSLKELRDLASAYGIPHYGRYSKLALYNFIQESIKNEKRSNG